MIDLHLGDCLEVMKQIPDKSVDAIICDLPYGTTQNKWDSVIPLDLLWNQYKRICKGAIVLTAQTPFDKVLGVSNLNMLKYEWIWKKESGTGFLNAKKSPLKDHENVLVFYEKQPTYNPQMRTGFKPYVCKQGNTKSQNYGTQTGAITESNGDRYPLTVIEFKRDKDKVHPTQKPVKLYDWIFANYTSKGDLILDTHLGSGSSRISANKAGLNFTGFETNKDYYEAQEKRFKDFVSQLRMF